MLENYILNGKRIMEEEFGFSPKKTKLEIYPEKEWMDFLRKKKFSKDIDGVFETFKLVAKIKRGKSLDSLPYLIHEYFGHGSFYEFSLLGKKLRDYEERILAGRKDLVDEYISLRSKMEWLYEGYAIWIEEFMLKKFNLSELWKKRKNELDENYLSYFEEIKNEEEKIGKLNLIYKIGFPRNFEKKFIIRAVEELLKKDFDKIKYLILYGSKKIYSDIDLLAVFGRNDCVYFNGIIDMLKLGTGSFKNLCKKLDLNVSNILLTGDVVIGDVENYLKILYKGVTEEAIRHAKTKSFSFFNNALYFYNLGVYELNKISIQSGNFHLTDLSNGENKNDLENINFSHSLNNLSFSLSYGICYKLYLKGIAPLTFKDVLNEDSGLISQIREAMKNRPTKNQTEYFLSLIHI